MSRTRLFSLSMLGLSLLAFVWVLGSPINQAGSDVRGSLLVSQALLETGSIRLDPYVGKADLPSRVLYRHHGRVDYYFPLGAPLLATPFVAAARAAGLDMVSAADEARLHKWLAALSVALAVALVGSLAGDALESLPASGEPSSPLRRPSGELILLSAALVFGTGLTSTQGTAFWSNNAALLGNLALLLLIERWIWPFGATKTPHLGLPRALALGAVATVSAVSRPTSALLFLLLFGLLLWRGDRRGALWTTLVPVIAGALFVLFSLRVYGELHPPYYHPARLTGSERIPRALYGNLLSPGRGLLVFSPLLALVVPGSFRFRRTLRSQPLFQLCSLWAGLHLLAISQFPHWWDGHSFGNRLYLEAVPAWLVLGLLVWREWRQADIPSSQRRISLSIAFLLGAFGIWAHAWQGLHNIHTVMWNGGEWGETLGDLNIDEHPEYLFDWRYPQMLASEPMIRTRFHEHGLREIPPLSVGETLNADADPRHFEGFQAVERLPGTEDSWRWSEETASIVFRLDPDRIPALSQAQLVVVAGSLDAQPVELSLNGSPLGWIEPEEHFTPVTTRFAIDPALLAESNRIAFRAPEAHAPAGDPRLLGLAFHELRLVGESHRASTLSTRNLRVRQPLHPRQGSLTTRISRSDKVLDRTQTRSPS